MKVEKFRKSAVRNQSMECCKLIASFFVIFLHVPFPGIFGQYMSCLSRFAVPMFFAISGYFSYQTNCAKLVKRIRHIMVLELVGSCIQLLWGAIKAVYYGEIIRDYLYSVIPTGKALVRWLLLNINPFSTPLWYLSATLACYIVLWLYIRFWKRKDGAYLPLYILGAALLLVHVYLSKCRLGVDYHLYRNAWFFGLPMFIMGLFLRQYQKRILEIVGLTATKLMLLVLLGAGLSLLEWTYIPAGEIYGGTVITAAALILLAAECPNVSILPKRVTQRCGALSTVIYLLHIVIYDAYLTFLQWRFQNWFGAAETWLRPVAVLVITLAAAVLYTGLSRQSSARR